MLGYPTEKTSTSRIEAKNLSVLETLIQETESVQVFYGDVGYTSKQRQEKSGEWKVFSGDLIPGALSRSLLNHHIKKAIFITKVEGKTAGIYTKDPNEAGSELISKINKCEISSEFVRVVASQNQKSKLALGGREIHGKSV